MTPYHRNFFLGVAIFLILLLAGSIAAITYMPLATVGGDTTIPRESR